MSKVWTLLCVVLVAAACTGATEPTTTTPDVTSITSQPTTTTPETTTTVEPVETADIVFTNGTIHTQDPTYGTVEALAITDDTITAVGTEAEIEAYVGEETRLVDLGGRTAIPGIVDAHTHILSDTGGVATGQPQALQNGITTIAEAGADQARLDTLVASSQSGQLTPILHVV